MLLTANDENKFAVVGFIKSIMDFDPGGEFSAMAVADNNQNIIGGIVYHNYDDKAGSIEISAASLNSQWLSKGVLHGMYQYPFEQLGCQIVYQQNSESNSKVGKILRRLGFNEYKIPRIRGLNDALMIYTLTKEQWLKGFGNGQK